MFFYLEPQQSIINDINTKLIGFYKGVRDDFSQLKKELTELERTYKSNRDEYDFLKNENPDIKIEDKNEKLYYELRDMYNSLIPPKYLDSTKSMMVISETPLIIELYKDYIFTKYDKSYSVNIKNRFDTDVKHLIITNYKK